MTITEHSLTTSTKVHYKIQKEKVQTTPMTTRQQTQNTFNTAHMNTYTWVRCTLCKSGSCRHWFTLHCMTQGCCVCHLIHVCDERFFFRSWVLHSVRPPSSSHSSFVSCISIRTTSNPMKTVANLCTPPKRVWTLWTRPTLSHIMSTTSTTSRRLTSSLTQSPWLQPRFSWGRRVRRWPSPSGGMSPMAFAPMHVVKSCTSSVFVLQVGEWVPIWQSSQKSKKKCDQSAVTLLENEQNYGTEKPVENVFSKNTRELVVLDPSKFSSF